MVLKPFFSRFVLVYFDDILVYFVDVMTHLEHLRLVVEVLQWNKLYISLKKCGFLQSNMELLGFIIGADELELLSQRYKLLENGLRLKL